MNTSNKPKTMTGTENHRSYLDWSRNMQVVRKGKGEIAMTEEELVRFFGGTWTKLNHRLQTIMKSSNLDSMEAYLFRKYISRRLQTETAIVPSIFLLGNTKN